jgi:hypothetical protein
MTALEGKAAQHEYGLLVIKSKWQEPSVRIKERT